MHVAITNDDGYLSPGLAALRTALLALGVQVTVVAPDGNRSAMGHSVTCAEPLVVRRHAPDDDLFSCSGRPADCARLAALADGPWPSVDVVASGINIGINAGDDLFYSGTFAAAAEAALLGVPSIAFSQQSPAGGAPFIDHSDYTYAYADYAARLVLSVGKTGAPPRATLNVNLPHRLADATPVVTRPGHRSIGARVPAVATGANAWELRPYATDDYPEPASSTDPATDFGALHASRLGVTPVDLTRAGVDHTAWARDVISAAGPVA